MPLLTFAAEPVERATIREPRVGCWSADVATTSDVDVLGPAGIELDGVPVWSGTVQRGGTFVGAGEFRIVGTLGLASLVAPQAYDGAPLRLLVADLARAAGLALSSTVADAFLAATVDRWTRAAGTVVQALGTLLGARGGAWRILRDGSLWVGVETWPELDFEHDLTDDRPGLGRFEIASELAELVPGVTFRGRKISHVVHAFEPGRVRSTALVE